MRSLVFVMHKRLMHDVCFALTDLLGFDRFMLPIPGTCSNTVFKGHILTSTIISFYGTFFFKNTKNKRLHLVKVGCLQYVSR